MGSVQQGRGILYIKRELQSNVLSAMMEMSTELETEEGLVSGTHFEGRSVVTE